MEVALIVIGCFAVGLWFVKGFLNSRDKRRDAELQAYYDALSQNNEADAELSDPEHVKRLHDHFND